MYIPIFIFTHNLKPASTIHIAQEVKSGTSQWLSISPENTPNLSQASRQQHSSAAHSASRGEPNFPSWSHVREDEQFDPNTAVDLVRQNPQLNCPKMFGNLHDEFFPENIQDLLNAVCCSRNIFEAQTLCMFACLYAKILKFWVHGPPKVCLAWS